MVNKVKHHILISPVTWIIASCLLLISSTANALGLGELEINSRLNEPLKAIIPLSATQVELNSLEVRLAPDKVFMRYGITPSDLLTSLNFEIVKSSTTPQIRITSNGPIREPLLEFVLSIRCGNGKVLKDFAAFLSP